MKRTKPEVDSRRLILLHLGGCSNSSFRGSCLKFSIALLLCSISALAASETTALAPNVIVDQYCAAARSQDEVLKGASMEVDIAAALPSMKKQGKLHALRHISTLGRITYDALKFEGDGAVKNQVIARYLTAEVESQKEQSPSLAVTPENYKFKYKGQNQYEGRHIHVFEVSPRKKRTGLFKGEVWIDAATYLRVRESGILVKNPSIFVKKLAFVRKYEIRDGISVPLQVQSVANVRMVGKAELTIDYSHFSIDNTKVGEAELQ